MAPHVRAGPANPSPRDVSTEGTFVGVDQSQSVGSRSGAATWKGTLSAAWSVLGPFVGLALITGLFAFLTRDSGTFLTAYTWRTIVTQTVVVATAALGMTIIMIAGGIDLSVGSVVALVTVALASLVNGVTIVVPETLLTLPLPAALAGAEWHLPKIPMAIAIFAGVLLGGLCGLVNGSLITGLRVVPFIITLGTLKAFRGVAKWVSGNNTVNIPAADRPWWFDRPLRIEPEPTWLIVAPGVWLLLGLCLLLAVALRSSLLGRYAFAVGSNEATARLCGVGVSRVKIAVYGIAGLFAGLAGVMQFLQLTVGDPTTADGLELQVIAAVVIGGGSLSGGEGSVLGTLIGCLIIGVLNAGCTHAGIPNATQDVIIGTIIVAAVALDRLRRRDPA